MGDEQVTLFFLRRANDSTKENKIPAWNLQTDDQGMTFRKNHIRKNGHSTLSDFPGLANKIDSITEDPHLALHRASRILSTEIAFIFICLVH